MDYLYGFTSDHHIITNIALALFIPYSVSTLYRIVYNVYFHPLSNYPGPVSRAAFHFPTSFHMLRGDSHLDLEALHRKYGGVVRITPNELSYSSAPAWKDIYGLRSNRTELAKDPFYYPTGTGVHLLNASQRDHSRYRKFFTPGFQDNALLEQESILNIYLDLLISKLKQQVDEPTHGIVDLVVFYNMFTFDIISDVVFGVPSDALKNEKLEDWMRGLFKSVKLLTFIRVFGMYPVLKLFFQLYISLLTFFTPRHKTFFHTVNGKTRLRLTKDASGHDIIANVLRLNAKTEQTRLTEAEILDNTRLLVAGGTDTTATHLSGAMWLLLSHPDVLKRAQTEVRTAFKSAEEINLRGVSNEERLLFLHAVIQESFRVYPSAPGRLARVTGAEGAVIDEKFVPANMSVGVHQYSAHRSKANFALPDEFHPERWLENERPEVFQHDKREALQHFSLGPRICLGKSLANFEIRSVLARMLWHFELELQPASHDWMMHQKEWLLWDKPELWVKLSHRVFE